MFPSEIYHYKDLQGFRQPYGLCGLWEASCNFLIIRALYVFSASTYDVISHLIPITSMSAEVVDGGRCLFYFNIYLFLFICIFREGNGEERGAPREKNEAAADRDSSSPKSAIFQFLA